MCIYFSSSHFLFLYTQQTHSLSLSFFLTTLFSNSREHLYCPNTLVKSLESTQLSHSSHQKFNPLLSSFTLSLLTYPFIAKLVCGFFSLNILSLSLSLSTSSSSLFVFRLKYFRFSLSSQLNRRSLLINFSCHVHFSL